MNLAPSPCIGEPSIAYERASQASIARAGTGKVSRDLVENAFAATGADCNSRTIECASQGYKLARMMIRVLGRPDSINVRKVLWLCAELALPHELEPWGAGFRDTQSDSFRQLNPNAMVPVLLDGDFVLWESNAICRYLAATIGRSDLLPSHPRERAVVEQWMDWQAIELNNAWRYAFLALVRKSPGHSDPGAIATSIGEWNRHMQMLDARLERTGAFVAGETFTLADVVLGLSANRWYMTPMQRPRLPAVDAWFERLSRRPAFLLHGRNGTP